MHTGKHRTGLAWGQSHFKWKLLKHLSVHKGQDCSSFACGNGFDWLGNECFSTDSNPTASFMKWWIYQKWGITATPLLGQLFERKITIKRMGYWIFVWTYINRLRKWAKEKSVSHSIMNTILQLLYSDLFLSRTFTKTQAAMLNWHISSQFILYVITSWNSLEFGMNSEVSHNTEQRESWRLCWRKAQCD